MLQKKRYKISNCVYGEDCVTVTVYYEGGHFLVMCHHAAYNHLYYYPEPDCWTGTVNICGWCVCMCVCTCVCGGGGGGFALLMH